MYASDKNTQLIINRKKLPHSQGKQQHIPSSILASTLFLISFLLLASATPMLAQQVMPAYWPAVSPDGNQVLFLSPTRGGPVYIMNADGSAPRQLTKGTRPSWFPDGKRIVVPQPIPDMSGVRVYHRTAGQ